MVSSNHHPVLAYQFAEGVVFVAIGGFFYSIVLLLGLAVLIRVVLTMIRQRTG